MPNPPPHPTVTARPAVSVLALRENAGGLEVFVQHRQLSMDFAAGIVAYPGGRVDPIDFSRGAAHQSSPVARQHARLWGDAVDLCFGPGSDGHRPGAPGSLPAAVLLAAALRELEEETGAAADPGAFQPWDVWTTPPGYPRRFDTYFYALNATGLSLQNITTEARQGGWAGTDALFEQFEAGHIELWRPTFSLLKSVHELGSLDDIHKPRIITPNRPDDSRLEREHHRKYSPGGQP